MSREENYVQVNGVYRHFKGKYYLVIAHAYKEEDSCSSVIVYQALYGEGEVWTRDLESFVQNVEDREDNITGQKHRMELIEDFNNQLSSVSTENLVKELAKREDNPFAELDLKEFEDTVFMRDFVVGRVLNKDREDQQLHIANNFECEELARLYMSSRMGTKLFKRLYIEIE